jgi:hypothetical protein
MENEIPVAFEPAIDQFGDGPRRQGPGMGRQSQDLALILSMTF